MRDVTERRKKERELAYWILRQEREIAEVKEQWKQQERSCWERRQRLEEEEDLVSKKYVPLGQTKLKRPANDESSSCATTPKPVWTRDGLGTWRRSSPVFDSPIKKNKVELRCDERMLNVDGLFREDDDQPDRRTDEEIMQQRMLKLALLLAKGEEQYAIYKPARGDAEGKELMKGRARSRK